MKLKNQFWNYDSHHHWYNLFTNNAIMLDAKAKVEIGANVITG